MADLQLAFGAIAGLRHGNACEDERRSTKRYNDRNHRFHEARMKRLGLPEEEGEKEPAEGEDDMNQQVLIRSPIVHNHYPQPNGNGEKKEEPTTPTQPPVGPAPNPLTPEPTPQPIPVPRRTTVVRRIRESAASRIAPYLAGAAIAGIPLAGIAGAGIWSMMSDKPTSTTTITNPPAIVAPVPEPKPYPPFPDIPEFGIGTLPAAP